MNEVRIWTDGSSYGKSNQCDGWRAVLIYGNNILKISGYDSNATNNTMELTAAIEALSALKRPSVVKMNLDSQYVINGFAKGWVKNWKKKGWVNSEGKPVANKELWERLDAEVAKHKVSWVWIKGHSGNTYNEMADQLAKSAKATKKGVKEYGTL
jgi:ribonuclease HI